MEQRIVQRACPGVPVRRINCNGDDVPLTRMCDFIETQIRTLGNRNHPIIIIFDREKRDQTWQQIRASVAGELGSRGLADQDLRIVVADRESEDWLLADYVGICRHFNIPVPMARPSGAGGLGRMIEERAIYHKTTIGVELFFVVSKALLNESCESFAPLHEVATEIGCHGFVGELLV